MWAVIVRWKAEQQENDEHKVDGDEVKLSGAARLPWLDGGTISFPIPGCVITFCPPNVKSL